MKIVFMGTPEFAVPSLQILVENGFDVVGVITAPDKPKGRGKKLQGTPVKDYAESVGLSILQPTNLKSAEFIEELKSLRADLQIVVAFRMLPEQVWDMPPKGTFNLHASLLPQYRGAAPINWAIINGEKETGATTFFLQHEIDTGNVIDQIKEPIHDEDSVGELYERLMHNGAKLVLSTVQQIVKGEVVTKPQMESAELKAAPKIHKETCEINWNQPSEQIRNFVRGLSPYPAAWTQWNDKNFKIYKVAHSTDAIDQSLYPGQIQTDGKNRLSVKTSNGFLDILEIQMEGKKRMGIQDLLRGYNFV
ncbi:methionyl-tRNA formyltransferase [Reichenbachiella agarivorans]|uniref:Methionyl-tRNA formyltransferase n=1 Tax=Reichenbachiella agarivorans TaxID=2979464 RepID=A0ABY6CP79_9BACT|nr:methionyl-tRNA formyltransferase [Reichenbachiella agarivorans]UXP32179.1 methionyl-tRNA formyltransferase [Reichenbachiella agarivorans]